MDTIFDPSRQRYIHCALCIMHCAFKKTSGYPLVFLCFLNELFLTLGATDADFSFSLGNTYLLAAAGAGEIPVIPVLQLLKKL